VAINTNLATPTDSRKYSRRYHSRKASIEEAPSEIPLAWIKAAVKRTDDRIRKVREIRFIR
jgi:hypothetical protein